MKKIPCPITSDRLSELYTKLLLTDEKIAEVLCKEGYDATEKRVRTWRTDYNISTLQRYERFTPPSIDGELKSLLIGSMLGDGRIAFRRQASHYEERHSPEQLDYLKWKADKWGEWSAGDLSIAYSRQFPSYIFRTKAHSDLNPYRDLFYKEREKGWKVVKPELVDMVDAYALAIWYLDDGYAGHYPAITFGAKEGSRANAYLIFEKFGLSPKWNLKKGETGEFHFKREEGDKFIEIIKPYVPDCMSQKMTFAYRDGRNNKIARRMSKSLLEEMVNKGYTHSQISKELEISESTIDRWLTKYGLKTIITITRQAKKNLHS
jgi:hypothetical protein